MKFSSNQLRWAICVLSILLNAFNSEAQYKKKITGLLIDSSNSKPVPWATVGLYKANNTQKPLQNLFSNSKGKFEFTEVDTGQYKVIVTYTGYRESETDLKVDSLQINIEMEPVVLIPESRQMTGVVVSGSVRKPLLEQEDEKMIFNSETDPSLEGLTAVDVLRKTPFVSVDGDGNIQLNGQTNFRILLNGKETAMFARNLKEALKSFPAGLIKKVEVSTNPSSKHDGEGVGGVINIITQKKVMGYNGSVGVSYNTTNTYNASGSLNVKYGKMGLSGYYGMGGGRPPEYNSHSEVESLKPVAFQKRISDSRGQSEYNHKYGNLEFAWDIDSLNTLSINGGLNGGGGNGENSMRYATSLPANGGVQESFLNTASDYNYPGYNLGLDYVRKLRGIAGREISFKAYYDDSKDDSYSTSEQLNPGADRFVVNDNRAPNKQGTIQLDYTHPFKNGNKLETGVKSIIRKAYSDYTSMIRYDKSQEYIEDEANSNNFNYRQDVYSAFATHSFKWKTISFKLGGRFEQTHIDGDFVKTNTRVQQDYGTFLPNVYLSRKFNKIHNVTLSYSKRLRRPYIWDLNPFVSNTDSFNISYGNPNLGPDIIHAIESGYSVFKGNTNINFRLSQSFSNRQITRYTVFDDATGVAATITENAGIARVTGLNINISTKFTKKLSFSTGTGVRYTAVKNRHRPDQRNSGYGGYAHANTSYQFNKKWTAYISGYFYQADPQLQGQGGRNFNYTIGTNYKLFNQKLTAGISAVNLFRKYQDWRSFFQDENFIRSGFSRSVVRNISFSLRWNFGKLTENVSRKRGVANDDIRK
ncbi:MAG: outer membrane beta-barrel protein [Chitinophagaceae bacterium]